MTCLRITKKISISFLLPMTTPREQGIDDYGTRKNMFGLTSVSVAPIPERKAICAIAMTTARLKRIWICSCFRFLKLKKRYRVCPNFTEMLLKWPLLYAQTFLEIWKKDINRSFAEKVIHSAFLALASGFSNPFRSLWSITEDSVWSHCSNTVLSK